MGERHDQDRQSQRSSEFEEPRRQEGAQDMPLRGSERDQDDVRNPSFDREDRDLPSDRDIEIGEDEEEYLGSDRQATDVEREGLQGSGRRQLPEQDI